MWGRALRVMPKVDKQEWDRLDLVSRWLIATRSAVLVMTFTSAAFAGLLALKAAAFDVGLWLLVTLGLLLAHATNNLINDLTDHWKGVDKDNYFRTQYGPQPVESGLLTTKQLMVYIAVTGIAALAIGAWLVALRGQEVLLLLGAGIVFVLFYTWPLKYIGLGEPAVLLVWGPLMVGGGYMVITGEWSNPVAVASIAYALGPTAVLFGKHIDKLEEDKAKGIRTLPVILGEAASRWTVVGMLVAQLGVIVYLVATGYFHPIMLVTLAVYCVASAFWYNRRFGGLFLVGLIADVVVSRI
jgi:1,4-dihydroxy-2-naphthoate octaprenyltransferase